MVRYVALLYLLRNEPVGEKLALRSDDIEMLADAFDRSYALIVEEIEQIMFVDVALLGEQAELMRRRLVVPAAGLLVGPTPAGMLVLVK